MTLGGLVVIRVHFIICVFSFISSVIFSNAISLAGALSLNSGPRWGLSSPDPLLSLPLKFWPYSCPQFNVGGYGFLNLGLPIYWQLMRHFSIRDIRTCFGNVTAKGY